MFSGLTVEFHKAALHFTSAESHCRVSRLKSLGQVCSGSGRCWPRSEFTVSGAKAAIQP
jgi:hypothetical protein